MKQRIIQISPYTFDHPGGVEQYARILQEIFPEDIITLSGGGEFPIMEPVKNCPLPCIWKRGFWKSFQNITPENTKYIISHIRFAPTSWLAFWIAKRRNIPYVHIEHGTGFLIHKNPLIACVAKMVDLTLGKYIIRHAEKVICISKAGKNWVSETFGRTDIEVIYRGFEFPQVPRVKNKIPKIGFVGRLTGLKNVAGLIEALKSLESLEWILEIVGDGEERTNLEQLTEHLGLENRVFFHGSRPHDWIMREFYPNIDIFINPSLQEGLPTTVIEALGMGCYVIATDVGGTREIEGIELIECGNQEAIIHSIKQTLGTGKENIGASNHRFSIEAMKQGYSSILDIG